MKLWCWFVAFSFGFPSAGLSQPRRPDILGGPLAGPVLASAPFSADAVMTVAMTFPDGTELQTKNTARYYRDSVGRARVEQVSSQHAAAPATSAERHIRTIVDDSTGIHTLDAATQTVHVLPRSFLGLGLGGDGDHITVFIGGVRIVTFLRAESFHRDRGLSEELLQTHSLGSRQVDGIEVVGTRTTLTVPMYALGNNTQPITILDERWESRELGLLISARHSDSRYGTIEYRLENIQRAEPPPALFIIPSGYVYDHQGNVGDSWLTVSPPERGVGVALR